MPFEALIQEAARTHHVPASWIAAVIQTESSFNPLAYRVEPKIHDASYGLMQLLEKTARGLGFTGPVEDLYKPEVNIPLGTALLSDLRQRYGDDFRRIYSAYNSGRPDLWQTSTQVGNNVKRAVSALEKYVAEGFAEMTASPVGSGVGVLLVFVLLWAWGGRSR